MPRRPIWGRIWSRITPPPRRPEDRKAPAYLKVERQVFYGWFEGDNPKPSYAPPRDAPCLYCGKPVTAGDVRQHNIGWTGPHFPDRAYYYRTHASCAAIDPGKGLNMDSLIWDMIARNGD